MNTKVMAIHIHSGLDLIGSRTSMRSNPLKGVELELVPAIGVKMYSKKTNRTIYIPFGNLKGIEMMPEGEKEALDDVEPDSMDIEQPRRRGRPPGAKTET